MTHWAAGIVLGRWGIHWLGWRNFRCPECPYRPFPWGEPWVGSGFGFFLTRKSRSPK